ncbi:MAG TPA: FAD-dependent oxidoreductase [Gemmatimonadaceae bacterium]|nr:FAD-dependent oxidoreductase [Gemmatimonadaceae bacterium]
MTALTRSAADVVVVGGGPAGAATAWALARAGVDVLVCERARFPRAKPCAEYLSPQASRLLAEMGALDAVERAGGAELVGMRVRAPNGVTFEGRFAASHGFRGFRDRGFALRRELLDAILLDCARAAGARVVEDARVASVLTDGAGRALGVRVHGRAGNGEGAGGATERDVAARFVVGADGLRSVVARRLALARAARWPCRIAFVTHYRGVEGIGDCGEMHVSREGYCGLADVGGGVTNVALVVPHALAAGARGDSTGFFERRLAADPALAPRFARAGRVSPVRVTGPFASHARRAWAPGAALVGDAADFWDPFTGEGIYAALRGGELLAPFLGEALRARTPRDADRVLAAYDRRRRREFAGKWRVERLVALAVAWPPLLNRVARAFRRRTHLADLFVGVTGDFVPPRELLRPCVLGQLLVSAR